jgi:hypothetical protein
LALNIDLALNNQTEQLLCGELHNLGGTENEHKALAADSSRQYQIPDPKKSISIKTFCITDQIFGIFREAKTMPRFPVTLPSPVVSQQVRRLE